VAKELEKPGGLIGILVGMNHMDEASREHRKGPELVKYKSIFRTGHMVCEEYVHASGSKFKHAAYSKEVGRQSTGL
jgi:hypothetical protein